MQHRAGAAPGARFGAAAATDSSAAISTSPAVGSSTTELAACVKGGELIQVKYLGSHRVVDSPTLLQPLHTVFPTYHSPGNPSPAFPSGPASSGFGLSTRVLASIKLTLNPLLAFALVFTPLLCTVQLWHRKACPGFSSTSTTSPSAAPSTSSATLSAESVCPRLLKSPRLCDPRTTCTAPFSFVAGDSASHTKARGSRSSAHQSPPSWCQGRGVPPPRSEAGFDMTMARYTAMGEWGPYTRAQM